MRTATKFRLLVAAFILGVSLSASQARADETTCDYDGSQICCTTWHYGDEGGEITDMWCTPWGIFVYGV
jgi:hypothetical protein